MKTTRQLRWLLISGLIGANLAFFVVTGYSILQTKQQFEHRAENLSQNVALAASQSIIASVEKIDLMLNGIKWEIESRFNSEHRTINPDLLGMLKHLQKSLPEVRAIRVANAEGIVVVGSGPQGNQHFSVVDRKYFAHHLSHDDNELYISKPLAGRLSDTPIVVFGRRLNFPNGDFAGVVYAIVDVKYLDQLLASFDLGEHGTITVRDSKLALITRWPPISDSPAGQTGTRSDQGCD